MEELSRVRGADPVTAYALMPPAPGEWGVTYDVSRAQITKANLLLVGPLPLVVNLVGVLEADPTPATVIRCRDGQLLLPPASVGVKTVVLRDVDALTQKEQGMLLEWMDSQRHRTQVVSTASAPLMPLVEAGAFNDVLYYRLNTVYVDLSE